MKAALASAVLIALAASPGLACTCPPDKATAEKAADASLAAKLKLTAIRLRIRPSGDPVAEATVQVLEQPKAGPPLPLRLLIVTSGGDENANCGRASQLFSAVSMQRWIRTQIEKTPDGRYEIGECARLDVEPSPSATKTN